jgi:hypothetical protein
MNNEHRLPDPALCGDLEVALGPLELGRMGMRLRYGFDLAGFSTTFVDLATSFAGPALANGLGAVAPDVYAANAQDPVSTLQAMAPEQHLGLLGYLMQQDMSAELRCSSTCSRRHGITSTPRC